MDFRGTALLVVLVAACAILNVSVVDGGLIDDIKKCYDTWSRCSTWSSPLGGILWQKCNTRCKCLGREGGTCVLTPSKCPLSNTAWQCQCHGTFNNPKAWWCSLYPSK